MDSFRLDPHAARYVAELDRRPRAGERLFAILNDRETEGLLIHEAGRGDPPLDGVVGRIEADPEIRPILEAGSAGHRFRQTVGVAVRLRMEELGWQRTGHKGTVNGAEYFKKAERFSRATDEDSRWRDRALAGLDRVLALGSEAERRSTGAELLEAIRATRAEQGRPF